MRVTAFASSDAVHGATRVRSSPVGGFATPMVDATGATAGASCAPYSAAAAGKHPRRHAPHPAHADTVRKDAVHVGSARQVFCRNRERPSILHRRRSTSIARTSPSAGHRQESPERMFGSPPADRHGAPSPADNTFTCGR
ncbi:hypothetical protein GQ57_31630 [Burkholderia sp. MSh2]|nr:hypothetical protein GQ57_31630 [Burkholderia sp. MSh2]